MRAKNILFSAALIISLFSCAQKNNRSEKSFTESFDLDSCYFSTTGRNQFFILVPGYQLVLEGTENGQSTKLVVTVLHETKKIDNIDTRVVEENESVNGQTVEVSRNYYAFCVQTNSVFYFGEDVDVYKRGTIVNHEGAWIAEGKNRPGLMMPGTILLGARYYQEIAPGIAMDRAEIISITEQLKTPAGEFSNCLKTEETNPLESKSKEYKIYAPGIGLIKDGELFLIKSGFTK